MIFHDTSEYCYEWLDKQPSVKEESLTDWLLYNISNLSPKVYYKAFTRNEESTNGADWEWWILINSDFETKACASLQAVAHYQWQGRAKEGYPCGH